MITTMHNFATEADYDHRLCAGKEMFIPDADGERSLLPYTTMWAFTAGQMHELFIPTFIHTLMTGKVRSADDHNYQPLFLEPEDFSAIVAQRQFGFAELLGAECVRNSLDKVLYVLRRVKRTRDRYEQERFALAAFHAICSNSTITVREDDTWLEDYLTRNRTLDQTLEEYLFLGFYNDWQDRP